MRRLLPFVAAAVLCLAGCSGGSAQESGSSTTTGSPTGAPTTYDDYVALGDSYTAAPLVPPTDTSNPCLRSRVNYPALVAQAMSGTTLVDVSCSGATTGNLTSAQDGFGGSVPPQLDALRTGTDLVTVGIGGNDFGLFKTLLGTCTKVASSDPTGAPCESALSGGGSDRLTRDLSGIREHVAAAVTQIRRHAPTARIVVVGYPQIIPASGTCPDLLPLASGDYSFARDINHGLAEAVRQAAADSDTTYVDLWGPSQGHDICADDPWINGRVTSAAAALAYHPFAAEQRAVADLVLAAIR